LTAAEAAEVLHLSVGGTYGLIRAGRLSERVLANFVEAGGRALARYRRRTPDRPVVSRL